MIAQEELRRVRSLAQGHPRLERLARKFYEFAYIVGKDNWSGCPSVAAFIRMLLDQAGVGREMKEFVYCRKRVVLPPSTLPPPGKAVKT